jgi:hypothetical protein
MNSKYEGACSVARSSIRVRPGTQELIDYRVVAAVGCQHQGGELPRVAVLQGRPMKYKATHILLMPESRGGGERRQGSGCAGGFARCNHLLDAGTVGQGAPTDGGDRHSMSSSVSDSPSGPLLHSTNPSRVR